MPSRPPGYCQRADTIVVVGPHLPASAKSDRELHPHTVRSQRVRRQQHMRPALRQHSPPRWYAATLLPAGLLALSPRAVARSRAPAMAHVVVENEAGTNR